MKKRNVSSSHCQEGIEREYRGQKGASHPLIHSPVDLKRKYNVGSGKGYASSPSRPPLAKAKATEAKKTAPGPPTAVQAVPVPAPPTAPPPAMPGPPTEPATAVPPPPTAAPAVLPGTTAKQGPPAPPGTTGPTAKKGKMVKGPKGTATKGTATKGTTSMPPPSSVPKKLEHGWLNKCVALAAMVKAGNDTRANALIEVFMKSVDFKNVYEQHTALLKTSAKDPKRAYVPY